MWASTDVIRRIRGVKRGIREGMTRMSGWLGDVGRDVDGDCVLCTFGVWLYVGGALGGEGVEVKHH